jgi:hypothetical protein
MRVAQPNAPMKYWKSSLTSSELLAGRGAIACDGWRWIVDAHREGRRYVVHSDEFLSAFLELEATLL